MRPAPAEPQTADEWDARCYSLGQARRWQEAAEACRKALALEKDHAFALYNLGWAEYNLGQYLPSRTDVGRSDHLQKGQRWETRYLLGRIAEALGEKSRAAVDYETAAALAKGVSPEPAKALERLKDHLPLPMPPPAGWNYFGNGRYGFRIFYPADWKPQPEPTNGDGRSFVSPDGRSRISAWGSFNTLEERPELKAGETPLLYGFLRTDERSKDGKSRIAWLRAYRIDEKLNLAYGVVVEVPVEQWEQIQPVIDTVMRSFRITFGGAYADF